MHNAPTEDFFEIRLSKQGATQLLRTFRIVRVMYALVLITAVGFLLIQLNRNWNYIDFKAQATVSRYILVNVAPFADMLVILLGIWQFTLYYIFISRCSRGVKQQRPDIFNDSFNWLLRNARVTLVGVAFHVLMLLFYGYLEVRSYLDQMLP